MEEIPKIIHYCWFGKQAKPASVQKYIHQWKKMLPTYEIIEWNESNCDVLNECKYVQDAYHAKKYAFVSDYFRVKALSEYGGVYLDTDVDIIKNFDSHIENNKLVLGFQGPGNIGTGFIAAVKHHPVLEELLTLYKIESFWLPNGETNQMSINRRLDRILVKYGADLQNDNFQLLEYGIKLFPTEYFCAFDVKIWRPAITEKSCTVHYMASSWRPKSLKMKLWLLTMLSRLVGLDQYTKIRTYYQRNLKKNGGVKKK